MICNNCGMDNPDGSAFCVSCGAKLNAPQQYTDYSQQSYQNPMQQQYQQYQQPQSPYPQQSYGYAPARDPRLDNPRAIKGAKVLYIIVGAIACLCLLMPFLPSVSVLGKSFNVFSIGRLVSGLGSAFGSKSAQGGGTFLIAMFILPMALQIPWAILSFARKRPAGVFGLISSIIYFIVSIIWIAILNSDSSLRLAVTGVPYFMLIFAIAGFVLSIIQLVKKKYLH